MPLYPSWRIAPLPRRLTADTACFLLLPMRRTERPWIDTGYRKATTGAGTCQRSCRKNARISAASASGSSSAAKCPPAAMGVQRRILGYICSTHVRGACRISFGNDAYAVGTRTGFRSLNGHTSWRRAQYGQNEELMAPVTQ